jgi:MFS family permease
LIREQQTLQSVISAYAVASAGFLLFGGRAADLLGRRRILATGLATAHWESGEGQARQDSSSVCWSAVF